MNKDNLHVTYVFTLVSQFDIFSKRGSFAHNCHLYGTVSNIPHSPNKIPDNTVFFFPSLFVVSILCIVYFLLFMFIIFYENCFNFF